MSEGYSDLTFQQKRHIYETFFKQELVELEILLNKSLDRWKYDN